VETSNSRDLNYRLVRITIISSRHMLCHKAISTSHCTTQHIAWCQRIISLHHYTNLGKFPAHFYSSEKTDVTTRITVQYLQRCWYLIDTDDFLIFWTNSTAEIHDFDIRWSVNLNTSLFLFQSPVHWTFVFIFYVEGENVQDTVALCNTEFLITVTVKMVK